MFGGGVGEEGEGKGEEEEEARVSRDWLANGALSNEELWLRTSGDQLCSH